MSKQIPMPWEPPQYDASICGAFQALASGTANDGQQRLALTWLVNDLCGYYDLSFRPGPDGVRASDFAEAKRFVGAQVVKMTRPETAAALKAAASRARTKKEASEQ